MEKEGNRGEKTPQGKQQHGQKKRKKEIENTQLCAAGHERPPKKSKREREKELTAANDEINETGRRREKRRNKRENVHILQKYWILE
jgi:hypothetical protein